MTGCPYFWTLQWLGSPLVDFVLRLTSMRPRALSGLLQQSVALVHGERAVVLAAGKIHCFIAKAQTLPNPGISSCRLRQIPYSTPCCEVLQVQAGCRVWREQLKAWLAFLAGIKGPQRLSQSPLVLRAIAGLLVDADAGVQQGTLACLKVCAPARWPCQGIEVQSPPMKHSYWTKHFSTYCITSKCSPHYDMQNSQAALRSASKDIPLQMLSMLHIGIDCAELQATGT